MKNIISSTRSGVRDWWRDRGTVPVLMDGRGDVRCSHVIPAGGHGAAFASLEVPSARLFLAGEAAELRALSEIAGRLAEWCEALNAEYESGEDPGASDLPFELGIPAEVWQAPITAEPPAPWRVRAFDLAAAVAVFVTVWMVWR